MKLLAPDEADEFSSPLGTFSIQAHFDSDGISESTRLDGVGVYANLDYRDGKKVESGGHVKVLNSKTLDKLTDVLGNIADITGQSVFSNLFSVPGQWSVTETASGYTLTRVDTPSQSEERKKKN
jgi:hypothetical protein